MAINTLKYIENCLSISTKNGAQLQFHLNAPQRRLYSAISAQAKAKKPIRVIILKARQMGFSTLSEAILFKATATKRNIHSAIVAHVEKATTNLFNMSKFYYETLQPVQLRPRLKASNAKELVFGDLNSSIECYTAGGDGIGRSATIQNLHISELAWWKCDKENTLLGLLQAVPDAPGTIIIIESTANGYEYFKELWDAAIAGENDYYPLFVGWNELDEYSKPCDDTPLTPEENTLRETYSLTNDQLSWRRWCIANNCGGDERKFRQEYPINPYEAFRLTGKSVFNNESVLDRLAVVPLPIDIGEFEYSINELDEIKDIKWVSSPDGAIKIYARPETGYPYVLAGDTAGDGSDNFTAQVIDNTNKKQVATLCLTYDEDLYANQIYCLGMYYNNALVGIESNFSTYPIKRLTKLGYGNQYMRETEDKITSTVKYSYGFRTDRVTRPIIINNLIKLMRESIELVSDVSTLKEFLTFAKNTAGRAEAQVGSHDDHVMALAIVYYICEQQTTIVSVDPIEPQTNWMLDNTNDKPQSYVDEYFN